MSSSSYTSNLSLSQFASLDKPSWLQDYNSDMSKIDGACKNFTGTDGSVAGTAGFVPAPATTDGDKFLKSDGTWAEAGGSSITLYDSTGQNTDGAMTQKAVTNMVFGGAGTSINLGGNSGIGVSDVQIGTSTRTTGTNSVAVGQGADCASNNYSTAIGSGAKVQGGNHHYGVALGSGAICEYSHSVALGTYSHPRSQGVVDVKAQNGSTKYGYQGTNDAQRTEYRVISGVHDGEDDHDVMTVGQVKTLVYKLVTSDPQQANTPADFIGQIAIWYEQPVSGVSQLRGRFICTSIDTTQTNPYYNWSTF